MENKLCTCHICGKLFHPYRPNNIYCSNECRAKGYKQKYTYRKKKEKEVECLQCGKKFITNDGKRKFCCKSCYLKHNKLYYEKKPKEKRTCALCGKTFYSAHQYQIYCSIECRIEARR
jgi:hypothetical protein